MILVSQRLKAEVDGDGVVAEGAQRGDCVAACLASIFELPLETFPAADRRQWVHDFLRAHYPGMTMLRREYHEPVDEAPHHPGYWIASILSDRFKEACIRCSEGGNHRPPNWYERSRCPWCAGSGIALGHHAVVMKGSKREWDPHPDCDWEAPLRFVGETVFVVSDPARFAPRMIPPPVAV